MRSTLTISDKIALRLRKVAERQNRSYKEVVNEALAFGLQRMEVTEPVSDYTVKTGEYGLLPGIDRAKFNQLYDELETEG